MTTIITSEDCGNSPKNTFLQDLTIAFARSDNAYILDRITHDIRWEIVGATHVSGKTDFAAMITQMDASDVAEITVLHVVSHGKAGAVNGTRKFKSGKVEAFCNVYEFSNAKAERVKEIKSYLIPIK